MNYLKYKNNKKPETMKKIPFYLFTLCLLPLALVAQSQNSNGKPLVIIPVAKKYIENYVVVNVEKWQIQDEFESTAEFRVRVNTETRDSKIKEVAAEATKKWIDLRKKHLSLSILEVKKYDSDNETFPIVLSPFGEIIVPVAKDENQAKYFKENYTSIKLIDAEFEIDFDNNELFLKKITFKTLNNKSYTYNSEIASHYSTPNMNFNIGAIAVPRELVTNAPKPKQSVSGGTSDVDQDIPIFPEINTSTFVLIIANEEYKQEEPILTALNDGKSMKNYCIKVLGIPEKNIKMVENATFMQMKQSVSQFSSTMGFNPEGKFLVFYFGHGLPNPNKDVNDSYLLPIDVSSKQPEYALSRNYMMAQFYEKNPKQCVIFLESCFSGAMPNDKLLSYSENSSGLRFVPKVEPVKGNIVVFAASTGTETANAYPEKNHNLFTYEFLKALKENANNDITLGELFKIAQQNTSKTAHNQLDGSTQTPSVLFSNEVENEWEIWKLR